MATVEALVVGTFALMAGATGLLLGLVRTMNLARLPISLLTVLAAAVLLMHGGLVVAREFTWTAMSSAAYYALMSTALGAAVTLRGKLRDVIKAPGQVNWVLVSMASHALFALYVGIFEQNNLLGLFTPVLIVFMSLLATTQWRRGEAISKVWTADAHSTGLYLALLLGSAVMLGSGYVLLLLGARHDWLWPFATALHAYNMWRHAPTPVSV